MIIGSTAKFTRTGSFTGSATVADSVRLPRTGRFTAAVSSTDDGKQTGGPLGVWPLVGIAAGALVLIVGVILAVWVFTRGRSVSVTSSTRAEMTADSLRTTESIDFAVRTFDSVTIADAIGTELTVVDADESLTLARNLIEDFL
jgi:hypothetical protein